MVAQPVMWTFLAASIAWTGCLADDCGLPDRPLGGGLFALLGFMCVLPISVLHTAWRGWLGWTLIGLGCSFASLTGYWIWAGVL